MTIAKFRVYNGARKYNGASAATVTIDRSNNFIAVRPHRQHRTYELRLEDVAQIIVERIIMAEVREKKAAKKAKRIGGLFGR